MNLNDNSAIDQESTSTNEPEAKELPMAEWPGFITEYSLALARFAAQAKFEEARERLGNLRFRNRGLNNSGGHDAKRAYLKLIVPEDAGEPPQIEWVERVPQRHYNLYDPDHAPFDVAMDEPFGYSDASLVRVARPFELATVLAIESEFKVFRAYCYTLAQICRRKPADR